MINALVPIIILKTYNAGGLWVGPVDNLRHPIFALTWVHLHDGGTMEYLTHNEAEDYEKQSINFREVAINNLAERSPGLFTHSKNDEEEFVYGIMMQDDGLGSSRLLLLNEFDFEETDSVFPKGYLFALPERSIGMVIRKDASAANFKQFEEMVKHCYENRATPMSPELFEADELLTRTNIENID
jgi:hypothetical protein